MTGVADYTAGFEARAREVLVPAARSVPALADRLAAAGEARAAELSMDSLAERYLELYDQVLSTRPLAPPRGCTRQA